MDGPAPKDIATGASAGIANPPNAVVFDYALVDINLGVIGCLTDGETDSFLKTFGRAASLGRAPAIRVGAGDVLEVSVFESGGLFSIPGPTNRGENFVSLPRQMVSSNGDITIPYVGAIHVAGRTVPEIERELESKLANRAVEPQVTINIAEQNASNVSVTGDATPGNRIRVSGSGERVMDVISKSGGLRSPAYEVFVTLQRKNRSATVYFPMLVKNAQENIFVEPGDVIYISREPRRFVAFGALGASVAAGTGLTGQFAFEQEHLSLNEAIAKAGGLEDGRADPAQVFLYRMERRETLDRMGVNLSNFAPGQISIPTVYRANFRDPSSFFFAQSFPMRNRDIIYVGNADANETTKFLIYVSAITGTMSAVATDLNTVVYHGP